MVGFTQTLTFMGRSTYSFISLFFVLGKLSASTFRVTQGQMDAEVNAKGRMYGRTVMTVACQDQCQHLWSYNQQS